MKKLIYILGLIVLFTNNLFSQSCPPNIDFENGDFSNWQCYIGTTSVSTSQNVITLSPSPQTIGRHEIISASTAGTLDSYGQFPKLCPFGGTTSVKLGNNLTGNQAEGISYTFVVPASLDTFSFTYFYAVVFENPGHNAISQPRFFVKAYDVATGQTISCASYDYVASGALPGFQTSPINSSVVFKPWSPVSLQFAGLAGHTVRLEFKTADCTIGGHFGYAYLDVSTGCSNILATAPYCVETNSVILNAPFGFQTYTWYNADYTAVVGNQQSITLSPPPASNNVFYVDAIPYPGFGCRDTFQASVTPLPVPDTPVVANLTYCQFQQAPAFNIVPSANCSLLWYTNATGGIGSNIAPTINTNVPGTFYYYVSQKKLFGCESFRKKITVTITNAPQALFSINKDKQCLTNNSFIFTSNSLYVQNGTTYTWYFDDGQTATGPVVTHTYLNTGAYNVQLHIVNIFGCTSDKVLPISVVPKPIADFTLPISGCQNQTLLNITNSSSVPNGLSNINQWWWSLNGNIYTQQNLSPFTANAAGVYPIKLVVTTSEGCKSDTTTKSIFIHYQPTTLFTYNSPLCNNKIVQFNDNSSLPSMAAPEFIQLWKWTFDNTITTSVQNPNQFFATGSHQIELITETNVGCKSNILVKNIIVNQAPKAILTNNDSCAKRNIIFTANDVTNSATRYFWNFGNGLSLQSNTVTKNYLKETSFTLTLIVQNNAGCSDTLFRPITIYENKSFAGQGLSASINQPVQLNANGDSGCVYLWTPSIGLNNNSIINPIAILDKDQLYQLDAVTREGCESHSKILIKRYKGPQIYIPNAFTPNGDGVNDILHVIPVGFSKFDFFAVYNRLGQKLFYTNDYKKGWDGTFNGIKQDPTTYVAIAKAYDYKGNVMIEKQSIILIR